MKKIDYHFDSSGKKIKTKWDSFDVDAEIERLENETNTPKLSKTQLEQRSCSIEQEFEAVLAYLDNSIRGDDDVRIVRKQIVGAINDIHFPRIDALRLQFLSLK